VDHYDALQAYHALWESVRVTIVAPPGLEVGGGGERAARPSAEAAGYHADALSLCFAVPTDVTAEGLVGPVERNFPRMVEARGEVWSRRTGAGEAGGGAGEKGTGPGAAAGHLPRRLGAA
jgi:hypothetical protein